MLVNMRKILICVICVCMSVCMIQPTEIYAANEADSETETQNEAKIKYEDMTLRDESSKTYVMSDGSMQKILYSIPVHYEEENEWKEIDNILIDESSEEASVIDDDSEEVTGYSSSKSKLKIKFSKKAHKNSLGSIQLGEYKIRWGIEDLNNRSEAIITTNNDKSNDIRLKVFENISQNIVYEDIFDNISLEYTFDSSTLKENIVLKERTEKNTFTFSYKVSRLTLALNENGEIEARDEASDALIFTMPRPYMIDDNGVSSEQVSYELIQQSDKKYQIKVTADSEWLNDESRAYPVVIDPVVSTNQNKDYIDTTFITSSKPNSKYHTKIELLVGNESSEYGICRTLIKFTLPPFGRGDMIVELYNASGSLIARYTYDSWGKTVSIKDASGVTITDSNSIANLNPIRYRGYYYDKESGYYYLNSRYYDPEVGRFISADSQLNLQEGMTGYNLFQYCGNNSINRIDPTGEAWWHWAIGAAVVAGTAVATVVTCGGFAAAACAVASVGSGVAATSTASTSSSVKEFNDKGNWGTVAATTGGAVVGGSGAYLGTKVFNSTPSTTKSKVTLTIKNDIIDLPRTGHALKSDPYHAFHNIVDNYAGYATKTPINNGTLYQLQGSLNGTAGRFEWIVQNQQVTHRMFVTGGGINGIPILK